MRSSKWRRVNGNSSARRYILFARKRQTTNFGSSFNKPFAGPTIPEFCAEDSKEELTKIETGRPWTAQQINGTNFREAV